MPLSTHCVFVRGTSPIIAAAIHNGHDTRKDVDENLAINEKEQLREEDPVTGEWTQIAKTQIVGLWSRFEVDLNRPRDKAVFKTPEDAWGIEVWDGPPDESVTQIGMKCSKPGRFGRRPQPAAVAPLNKSVPSPLSAP